MKTLKLMALAILLAIAGTSFVEAKKASSGSCSKHRHLHTRQAKCKTKCRKGRCKTHCTPPKTTCEWDKGYPKKPKMPANVERGTLYNLLADTMPIAFYTSKGGSLVYTGLPQDNGKDTIGSNPSADDSTYDSANYNWAIKIPAGATFVEVGPSESAMDEDAVAELSNLSADRSYKISSNYSDENDLQVELCTTTSCL